MCFVKTMQDDVVHLSEYKISELVMEWSPETMFIEYKAFGRKQRKEKRATC